MIKIVGRSVPHLHKPYLIFREIQRGNCWAFGRLALVPSQGDVCGWLPSSWILGLHRNPSGIRGLSKAAALNTAACAVARGTQLISGKEWYEAYEKQRLNIQFDEAIAGHQNINSGCSRIKPTKKRVIVGYDGIQWDA
jgi:hypothetical protein